MKSLKELMESGGKEVSLSAQEKQEIFWNILRFINVRSSEEGNADSKVSTANAVREMFSPHRTLAGLLAALLIFIGFGASISYAAESALPGHALYSLKVNVLENILSSFQFTERAKGNWEARRAERRLEEAELLVTKSSLNEGERRMLVANLQDHIGRARNHIEELSSSGDSEGASIVATTLETSLVAHENVLRKVDQTMPQSSADLHRELRTLLRVVQTAADEAEQSKALAEQKLFEEKSAKAFDTAAQASIEDAARRIEAVNSIIQVRATAFPTEMLQDVQKQLSTANVLLSNARRSREKGDTNDAYESGRTALRIAEDLYNQLTPASLASPSSGTGSSTSGSGNVNASSSVSSEVISPSSVARLVEEATNRVRKVQQLYASSKQRIPLAEIQALEEALSSASAQVNRARDGFQRREYIEAQKQAISSMEIADAVETRVQKLAASSASFENDTTSRSQPSSTTSLPSSTSTAQ